MNNANKLVNKDYLELFKSLQNKKVSLKVGDDWYSGKITKVGTMGYVVLDNSAIIRIDSVSVVE